MTWPVVPPTYGTYNWFAQSVAIALGIDPAFNSWNFTQKSKVDLIIQRGLKQFYFPPPLPAAENLKDKPVPHRWTFLTPVATISTTAADVDYDLPADFNGSVENFTYAAANGNLAIRIVPEDQMRSLRSVEQGATAPPKFASIRPKTSTGSAVQTWEVLLYPTPDASYTLTYRYRLNPPVLSTTVSFPFGGTAHVETMLASMLAIVEGEKQVAGPAFSQFMMLLASSISTDLETARATGTIWELIPPVIGTYSWLLREVGYFMDLPANPDAWSFDQRQHIDSIVERGVAMYYRPPRLPDSKIAHEWSFLCPVGSITTNPDVRNYLLPDDFDYVRSSLTYTDDNNTYGPIPVVSEERLRQLFNSEQYTSPPRLAAVRPLKSMGNTDQRQELVLHPTPDASYVLSFRYNAIQHKPSLTSEYLLGGQMHAEGVLAACLSLAEEKMTKKSGGSQYKKFIERLTANIAGDIRRGPQFMGRIGDYAAVGRGELRAERLIPSGLITYGGIEYEG